MIVDAHVVFFLSFVVSVHPTSSFSLLLLTPPPINNVWLSSVRRGTFSPPIDLLARVAAAAAAAAADAATAVVVCLSVSDCPISLSFPFYSPLSHSHGASLFRFSFWFSLFLQHTGTTVCVYVSFRSLFSSISASASLCLLHTSLSSVGSSSFSLLSFPSFC